MTTSRCRTRIPVTLVLSVGAVILAACSGASRPTLATGDVSTLAGSSTASATSSSSPGSATTVAGVTTSSMPAAATTVARPVDSGDIPVPTEPVDSADIAMPPVDSSDVPSLITVTVGKDSSPTRVETVSRNALVSITIINGSKADTYVLQGYNAGIGQPVAPGKAETLSFRADTAGEFALVATSTNTTIMTLRVV